MESIFPELNRSIFNFLTPVKAKIFWVGPTKRKLSPRIPFPLVPREIGVSNAVFQRILAKCPKSSKGQKRPRCRWVIGETTFINEPFSDPKGQTNPIEFFFWHCFSLSNSMLILLLKSCSSYFILLRKRLNVKVYARFKKSLPLL